MARASNMKARGGSLPVEIQLIDEADFSHKGHIDFVDNAIDRSSGTIRGRAVLANADLVLTPGMFGRVRLPGSPPYTAMLVPDAAIGSEQVRKYVLTVGADDVVTMKYVTVGTAFDNLRVIKDGLAEDDRVIVNGLMRARPNQKVTPQDEAAPANSPGSPQAEAEAAKSAKPIKAD
jgi:RND family efflux transporter MFP subunit